MLINEERCQTADTGLDSFAETTGEKWKKSKILYFARISLWDGQFILRAALKVFYLGTKGQVFT
jgi:hypothetical protein